MNVEKIEKLKNQIVTVVFFADNFPEKYRVELGEATRLYRAADALAQSLAKICEDDAVDWHLVEKLDEFTLASIALRDNAVFKYALISALADIGAILKRRNLELLGEDFRDDFLEKVCPNDPPR